MDNMEEMGIGIWESQKMVVLLNGLKKGMQMKRKKGTLLASK